MRGNAMGTAVFYWLLSMSILGSLAGLCVLLLRRWHRLPRRLVFLLWVIPALRLWLPVTPIGQYNLATMLSRLFPQVIAVPVSEGIDGQAFFSRMNCIGAAEHYSPMVFKTNPITQVFQVAGTLWCLVAAALLLTFGLSYLMTLRGTADAVRLQGRIYCSAKVTTPAVYGILRPRILIPESCREEELPFIVLHESCHIRRLDNLWRILAVATASLHWFNPLVWLFLRIFLQDLELACDEGVLARCGEAHKRDYAAALLNSLPGRELFASAFGGVRLRTRVAYILSYQKCATLSALCFGALLLALAYVLLTNSAGILKG